MLSELKLRSCQPSAPRKCALTSESFRRFNFSPLGGGEEDAKFPDHAVSQRLAQLAAVPVLPGGDCHPDSALHVGGTSVLAVLYAHYDGLLLRFLVPDCLA